MPERDDEMKESFIHTTINTQHDSPERVVEVSGGGSRYDRDVGVEMVERGGG